MHMSVIGDSSSCTRSSGDRDAAGQQRKNNAASWPQRALIGRLGKVKESRLFYEKVLLYAPISCGLAKLPGPYPGIVLSYERLEAVFRVVFPAAPKRVCTAFRTLTLMTTPFELRRCGNARSNNKED
jgi:hypothetical protein